MPEVPQESVKAGALDNYLDLRYDSALGFETSPPPESPKEAQVVRPPVKPYTPIPLRRWFAITLLTFMVLVAAALEIALHFSRVQNGWKVPSSVSATKGILHYIYTLPPVAIAMIIVALWTWTDVNIKRIQPYLDLAYGNAPAEKTMLLDYSTQHPALVSASAYRHRHYIVAISSTMVLFGLGIQPLAASLFTVEQVWWDSPNINVTNFEVLGLNPSFNNLTAFSTAGGFVQGTVLYNVTPPNFVNDVWAIAQIEVPSDQVANGTMFANLPSIQSLGNCNFGNTPTLTPFSNGTGFTMSGISPAGCGVSIATQGNTAIQYGVEVVTCPNSPPPDPFKPVVFWAFSQPSPSDTPISSLIYCTPSLQFFNSMALVSLQSGDLQSVTNLTNVSQPNNITDPTGPLGGHVLNGVAFNLTNADSFTRQRAQTAVTGLNEAIIQMAQMSPGGLSNQIQSQGLVPITETLYHLYLSLAAKEIYFVPTHGFNEVGIKTFQPRLFIVEVTAHILTGVLFAFAIIGGALHFFHYHMRDLVILPRKPGTLASAAALTARSNVNDVLDGNFDEETFLRCIRNKRFRLDRKTGRIVMAEDNEEFESWAPPRPKSFFG